MFRTLPTTNLRINSNGSFTTKVETKEINGIRYARIVFHGVKDWYSVPMLTVTAITNCPLGLDDLKNMRFVKQKEDLRFKLPGGYFIWFTKDHPEVKPGLRIVPGYWNCAVNIDGTEVIARDASKAWRNIEIKREVYFTVRVFGIFRTGKNLLLHRLVALAWVKNDKPSERNLVDHDDGNKHNPKASNLEWVTYAENNAKAYKQGLKTQNKKIYVKHIASGEVKEFFIMKEAADYIGCTASIVTNALVNHPNNVFYKHWLLSTDGNFPANPIRAVQRAEYLTGPIGEQLTMAKTVREAIGNTPLDFVPGISIPDWTRRLGKIGWTIEPKALQAKVKGYQVLHIESGRVKDVYGIRGVFNLTGIIRSTIKKMLRLGPYMENKGYAVRELSGDKWPTTFKSFTNVKRNIKVTDKDGNVSVHKSIRSAEKLTGINQKAIARSLKGEAINFDLKFEFE